MTEHLMTRSVPTGFIKFFDFMLFYLFILSVSFCCGLFMYCSSVLCGLNQGIAAKGPCAQSISP